MRAISPFFSAALILLACGGCGRPPDPNDPAEAASRHPEVLQRNLKWASDFVNERVALGEIDAAQGQRLLVGYAAKIADAIDLSQVADGDAWRYGDVYRTAERWELADKAFQTAARFAENSGNNDRWVNDTLHWAEAKAHLGQLDEAIRLAKTTFRVPPHDKAPILMAILYEIVPAGLGKGQDGALADLLMDAIDQHHLVVVDIQTEAGAAFYGAKGHHLEQAWRKVFEILEAAGRTNELQRARDRKYRTSTRRA